MNPHITYSGGITFPQPPPGLSGSPGKGGGVLQLQNNRMSMHQNKNSSMHGGVEDVSYGLQNMSIQHSDENKENSVSGQAIGPWTKKWRAKLQSRQLAASSNSIASGSGGVGNVLAAAAVVGQNNSNVQTNSIVQKKKVKKLPEEKIAERISRKNGKKAQDEQKKNDIKTVVTNISSTQQKKKADHLPILPAEDSNYVGRSSSSSGGGLEKWEKSKRKKKNKKKKGKKGTNGTSSFTTNAKGASVLEMLGDYAAAATATEGAPYNNDESTTYPTSVMPASCIDNNQTALQLDTSYSVQQQQIASYDAQQQYPIYTAAQGTNVLMPAGYYVPNQPQIDMGTVYYNQQPNVPQPVSWALESDANYYMYNGTTYATDKKLAPQTLNVNAPVFNPKMSRNDA